MKIALVHDWVLNLGGAERTLIALHEIFPNAPIYTLFHKKKLTSRYLPNTKIVASRLQRLPFVMTAYPYLAFIMPSIIESFDLSEFDLVISSSVIFSKGLVLKPKTRHICYCYSPTRFLWDRNSDYERSGLISKVARHYLRIWDRLASDRVDEFIAISKNVQDRIKKYYHRDSKIIFPPVNTYNIESDFVPTIENYYLIVSRLYDYKNIALVIDTFNKLKLPLIIIGDGPTKRRLKRMAGDNVDLLGFVSDEFLAGYYKNCRAFIMPQEEDFGIAPVEAMAYGKPVVALRRGGAMEIIEEGVTGEFFDDPIPEALADGIRRLNDNYHKYSPNLIKESAKRFSLENFRNAILEIVE